MEAKEYPHKELTQKIIGAAYEVHNELGSGFVEKVYENALAFDLRSMGMNTEQQKPVTVNYKGTVAGEFIADLVVNNAVLLEIKAVKTITKEFESKLLHYLKATGINVGLIINFSNSVQVKRKVFCPDFHHRPQSRKVVHQSVPTSVLNQSNPSHLSHLSNQLERSAPLSEKSV